MLPRCSSVQRLCPRAGLSCPRCPRALTLLPRRCPFSSLLCVEANSSVVSTSTPSRLFRRPELGASSRAPWTRGSGVWTPKSPPRTIVRMPFSGVLSPLYSLLATYAHTVEMATLPMMSTPRMKPPATCWPSPNTYAAKSRTGSGGNSPWAKPATSRSSDLLILTSSE